MTKCGALDRKLVFRYQVTWKGIEIRVY